MSEDDKPIVIEKKIKGYREKENLVNGFKLAELKNKKAVDKGTSLLKCPGEFFKKDMIFLEKGNRILIFSFSKSYCF